MATDTRSPPLSSSDQDVFLIMQRRDIGRLQSAVNDMDNLNIRDSASWTLLMHAVLITDDDTRARAVRLLLRHGCDVNAQDDAGRTALMYACMDSGRVETVRQLVKKRSCDPNVYDKDGNTALMHCVKNRNAAAIKVLTNQAGVQHRLKVSVVDRAGHSALEMAIRLGLKDCCRILVRDGGAGTSRIKHHSRLFLKRLEEEELVCADHDRHFLKHFEEEDNACTDVAEPPPLSARGQQPNITVSITKSGGVCSTSGHKTQTRPRSALNQPSRKDLEDGAFFEEDGTKVSSQLGHDNIAVIMTTTSGGDPPHPSDRKSMVNRFLNKARSTGHVLWDQPGPCTLVRGSSGDDQPPGAEPAAPLSRHSTTASNSVHPVAETPGLCSFFHAMTQPLCQTSCHLFHRSLAPPTRKDVEQVQVGSAWAKLPPLEQRTESRFSRAVAPMFTLSPHSRLPSIAHGKSE